MKQQGGDKGAWGLKGSCPGTSRDSGCMPHLKMGAATQLWLICYHVRMGAQSSQSTFHFQKVKNTDLYMKCPTLLCVSTKYITGLQTTSGLVISVGQKNYIGFFNLVLICFYTSGKGEGHQRGILKSLGAKLPSSWLHSRHVMEQNQGCRVDVMDSPLISSSEGESHILN